MCLAIPGKVLELDPIEGFARQGKVSFGGVAKTVHFDLLPDVEVGDYVLVHVGVAISKVDEETADEIFQYLDQMGEIEEAGLAEPEPTGSNTGTTGTGHNA